MIELSDEDVISTTEAESLGKIVSNILSIWNVKVADVLHEVALFHVDRVYASSFVDHDHSIGLRVSAGYHGESVGELLSGEKRARGDLIHVEETQLGYHEENSELWAVVQEHWEVFSLIELDIGLLLKSVGGSASDLHNVESLSGLTFLSLAEAEQVAFVADVIGHRDAGEAGGVSLENLLLLLLGEVELNLAHNAVGALVDSNQEAPLPSGVDAVVHDLAVVLELGLLVKYLLRGSGVVDARVIDGRVAHDAELILTDPSPEAHLLRDLALLYFGLGVQVEDLDHGGVALESSGCEHVSRPVHEHSFGLHGLFLHGELLLSVDDGDIRLALDTDVLPALKGQ